MTYLIPNAFIREDEQSRNGNLLIYLPQDFVVKCKIVTERKRELSAYDYCELINDTTADYYKQTQAINTRRNEKLSDWNYVSIPERARIAVYDDSTLFKMPNGEYQDYTYFIPNKCVKETAEKDMIRLDLHNDYTVRPVNNTGKDKRTVDLSARSFAPPSEEKTKAHTVRVIKSRVWKPKLLSSNEKGRYATLFPTR